MSNIYSETTSKQWRDVPGYEGMYRVSDQGEVVSLKSEHPRMLRLAKHPGGYRFVALCKLGGKRQITIHRLVMLAFIGEPPEGVVINHKNGKRDDNRLDNLEYCTQMENIHHAINVLGFDPSKYAREHPAIGERNPAAKLKNEDIPHIRRRLAVGETQASIGKDYGVDQRTISLIKLGKMWAHV